MTFHDSLRTWKRGAFPSSRRQSTSWLQTLAAQPTHTSSKDRRLRRPGRPTVSSDRGLEATVIKRRRCLTPISVYCAVLRPVQPKTEEDEGFEVGDGLDSFERDEWWTGKFDKAFKGEGGGEVRYVVNFADPKHEIEFGKDSLRLHLDWSNGKWLRFWNGKPQMTCQKPKMYRRIYP